MSLILIVSIVIRLVAMGLSILLLRRIQDWRVGFLTVMLGLMALRQTLTLLTEKESWAISVTGHATELLGLIVSIMAFLAVFFLERIIPEWKRAEKELQERRDENTKLAVIAEEPGELQDWINTFDTFVGKFSPNGVGIIFNETPIKAGGLTKDDVVGKHFPDTMWWSHSEIEKARIVECFEKAKAGLSSRIETNFRSADGTPVPIIFNCQPVMDDDDKVKYITAEGIIIIEELKLRNALQKEKESLGKRVKERTSELVAVNEELREEIAERKKANEALRESEEKFRRLSEEISDGIAVTIDGKNYWVNKAFSDIFGYTREELIGKEVDLLVVPDEVPLLIERMKDRLAGKDVPSNYETIAKNKDGKRINIDVSAKLITFEGKQAIQIVVRDITERKLAEDRIQHLQSVLMAIRNIDKLIVHEKNQKKVLQGACDILNQTRNYKLVWMGLVEEGAKTILPAAQAGFEEGYLRSIKITWDDSETGRGPTGTAIKTRKPFVMRDISSDPRYKPWREEAMKRGYASSAAMPLVYEDRVFGALNVYATFPDSFDEDEIALLVEVGQDIAFALHNIEVEEKRNLAEESLRKAHEELEVKVAERTRELALANIQLKEIDRLKSEFLATMSHELRTPLNSIIGFTGIILKGIAGEINEEQRKQLSLVYGSAKHLLNLINDILDLSRIESGKMDISVERFKIGDVISEVAHTLSPMISQKGLRLLTEIPDETPEIYSDRKKILQILLNLVNNAIKFTNKGEIKIECKIDNTHLKVSVSDTGIGIKRGNMDHLFESFRQIDGRAQRRYEGAGLGLYLCQKLVTLLGGKIWAESEYGKGSRFTFIIPVRFGGRGAT